MKALVVLTAKYTIPLSDRFTTFISDRTSSKYPGVNNKICLPIILLNKNDIPEQMTWVLPTTQSLEFIFTSQPT